MREKVRLGDVCTINGGYAFKSDQFSTEGVPVIRIGNITKEGLIIDEDVCYDENFWNENDSYRIAKNDILIAMSGATVGKSCINNTERKLLLNQRVAAINCDNNINLKYIFYSIDFEKFSKYIMTNSIGCAQPNISLKQIANFEIPAICVEEQNRIAGELDKVADVINKRKQQLKKLDELVKARFVELFGGTGKQVPLTDYVWFQEGPGVRSVDFTDDGTILLTGSNINDNTISFGHKSDRHISNELASGKYAHFMCDKDDILVVSSAIDPDKFDKKVVVVDVDKKYCLNTGIIRFKPNKQYLTLGYFREFLKTDYFKHQVSSEMRGIAQMHFGPSHLKQMTILLPDSIERQIEFESFVKQTDKSKLEVQKSLEKLELLKKALMQKYFG